MAQFTRFRSGVLRLITLFVLVIVTNACTAEVIELEDDDMAAKPTQVGIRGWSQGGDLVTGRGQISGEARGAAVVLQANLEEEDSLTTQFNVSGPRTGYIANIRAEILSSVKGNTVRRLITVSDGSSITTRGRNITVRVRDNTFASISTGVKYNVQVLSTLGVRAAPSQPPTLAPLTFSTANGGPYDQPITGQIDLAVLTSRFVQVPQDSGVNSVFVQALALAPIAEGNLVVAQSSAAGLQSTYDPRQFATWVPLLPNVTQITLTNADPAVAARMAVIFGIDG